MAHSNIKWDKLDNFIEQSKDKVNDFKRLEEIENEKKELHKNEQVLVDEENKIRKKYKQEYTKRLNNIINELEKYIIDREERSWDDNGAYDDVLDKLQELKGDGSN